GGRSRQGRRLLSKASGSRQGFRQRAAGAREREEIRAAVKRFAGLVRASVLCAAIVVFVPIAAADPSDADPDLATRDEDYAAGRKAVEKKDWTEAARLLERAEVRHPDHADLQNNL